MQYTYIQITYMKKDYLQLHINSGEFHYLLTKDAQSCVQKAVNLLKENKNNYNLQGFYLKRVLTISYAY